MRYDHLTRWLHAGIALTVSIQLLASLAMRVPRPDRPVSALEGSLFEVHEVSGLTALALLAVHWLWQLTGHLPQGFGHLFPWFSADRLRRLGSELSLFLRLRWQRLPESGPLAGAVHGLGLLLVTIMGASGGAIFLGLDDATGRLAAWARTPNEVHETLAPLVWGYLIGHVALALWHQARGERAISRMFALGRQDGGTRSRRAP